MVWISFTGNSSIAVDVDWNIYHQKKKTSSADKLVRFISVKKYWRFSGPDIDPISGNGEISDWINDLSSIVGLLQEENIPWKGTTLGFSIDYEPKIMVINQSGLYIVHVSHDASTSTEFFPLGNTQKLN